MFSLDQIRAAYKAGEFFLEYLPTISLVDNRCVGGEALIRWRQPDRVVPPLEFIRQVEHTPLSGTLTYWVLETVGKELGAWLRNNDDVYISINVPPEILGRGGLRYVVEKTNMRDLAGKLMIEITERGVPDALGIAALGEAYRAGALIALDDVNLNEANLVVLSRIQTDVVKFDKSFADRMLRPDWNHEEIDTLATLIQNSGFRVIVEGVETAAQAAILKNAGVELVQGFFFSEPLPAADFIEYCSARQ
jgi:sensor c-di-GMP phosphodiesterase-like protein